ncbi:succinyl-diaminopimelate desuccinylase [Arenimonas fontis]|uniref:Succinyl-diaminopimelate desuccinylase n=1 Tax=Arenimonas fontis TaxID=2608255 RepID=A0A5B2ZGP1_9GAMM|nr:succinyl-diaminopimelate desuccinylase [Arenimonas fontis]KAA2286241.1 succinyl-diaminopimelate desuccinylase [Arenimonas fontis]
MSDVLRLTKELIARPSVTPEDAGCQALLSARLQAAGFRCRQLDFGAVKNLWASHGEGGPVLLFLGHTDVVPPGPREAWDSDPFEPVERDGWLYGRGAADMKGSVAAMLVALERFVAAHPGHPGTVALLLTSDEEGDAIDGVRRVAQHLRETGQPVHYCVTGEPSSKEHLGDLLRVGRRGTLSGTLLAKGIQGHVAYPDKARNPIHDLMPALAELCARRWDPGYPEFPPTSFQISNIHAGTGANNVIPGHCELLFNFRYNPGWQAEALQREVEETLRRHGVDFELRWHRGGEPFLTPEGRLRAAARAAIAATCGGIVPEENTGGGTSDARFIAPLGAEVVELGPVNASIHKANERIAVAELEHLPMLYRELAERLLLA